MSNFTSNFTSNASVRACASASDTGVPFAPPGSRGALSPRRSGRGQPPTTFAARILPERESITSSKLTAPPSGSASPSTAYGTRTRGSSGTLGQPANFGCASSCSMSFWFS